MLIAPSISLHRSLVEPMFGPAVGAPERDVASLEARLSCRFPEAYRDFLLWMGADRTGLLRGTECFIGDVEANERGLADLLAENELPTLAYRPVVFFMHQGYIACWFRMGDNTRDPEVFSFSETEPEAGVRTLGTFSHWLYVELSALAKAI